MEIEFGERKIKFEKVLNYLDKLAIDFCKILATAKIKYAIISGYEAILFGRNRASEDIDVFVEKTSKENFKKFWELMEEAGFWCINADFEDSFTLLEDGSAPRFARKNEVTPNVEVKYAKENLDFFSLNNRVCAELNGKKLFIGPIELNIAYKLYLGSQKDFEDAVFLYNLFKDKLNSERLISFIHLLKVEDRAKENLWSE